MTDRVKLRTGYTVHTRGEPRHGTPITACGREIREEDTIEPGDRPCLRCQEIQTLRRAALEK